MLNFVDKFLNKITMYRLILYVLMAYFACAFTLSLFNLLPYPPLLLGASMLFILWASWLINLIFVKIWRAPANIESVYITAFILFFLISPLNNFKDINFIILASFASLFAVASKYILAIKRKHLFNPAAIALVLTAFLINKSGSWWVSAQWMLPFVLLGGFLIARKTQRGHLVWSFILSAIAAIGIANFNSEVGVLNIIKLILKDPSFYFLATIMLTEPLTSPADKNMRIIYGVLVGILFSPLIHFGEFYFSPEFALVIGNLFAYIVSPKEKMVLRFKKRNPIASDTFEFVFDRDKNFAFTPGQYMEWTLAHPRPDTRGNRRYFTIASSPTEDELRLGIKFYPEGSSFKKELLEMEEGKILVAAQKSGEFTMPRDINKGLVFIAGGIGITPFRSMIKHMLDTKERRSVTLFYSNRTVNDIAYKEIFESAERELGLKTIYNITDKTDSPLSPQYKSGFVDAELIKKEVPDHQNKIFYISGPHEMVKAFEKILKSIGVSSRNIKIDFFPGYA